MAQVAEDSYQAAIAEPGARPATIGTALARLGALYALYALHGNRRLAQRIWRRDTTGVADHVHGAITAGSRISGPGPDLRGTTCSRRGWPATSARADRRPVPPAQLR